MSPSVSVVVPIYNVERYLARCLESLAAQGGPFEFLLVDDGSTDGSAALAETYPRRDPRFRLLRRENGGLGAARNTGLDHARGEFVFFADSDDRLPPGALARAVERAQSTTADVVRGHFAVEDEITGEVHEHVTGSGLERELYDCMPWDKLIRRSLFERVCFTNLVHEDVECIPRILARSRRTEYLPEVLYVYLRRQGSLSRNRSMRAFEVFTAHRLLWHDPAVRAHFGDSVLLHFHLGSVAGLARFVSYPETAEEARRRLEAECSHLKSIAPDWMALADALELPWRHRMRWRLCETGAFRALATANRSLTELRTWRRRLRRAYYPGGAASVILGR